MQNTDILIVGSGLIGLSMSLSIAKYNSDLQITLIGMQDVKYEKNTRVSSINLASEQFLNSIGAWKNLIVKETCEYTNMEVWENDNNCKINFNCFDKSLHKLGTIVENQNLQNAILEETKKYENIKIINNKVKDYLNINNLHMLTLEDSSQLIGTFLIVADGANSQMCDKLNTGIEEFDYAQNAITCVVKLPKSHNNTAYQAFNKDNILAYLPLPDDYVSIVWSLDNHKANYMINLTNEEFLKELYVAFNNDFYPLELISNKYLFPLKRKQINTLSGKNWVVIGDAAHTIHPLAGQGVNLGFADVWRLADLIEQNFKKNIGLSINNLNAYARERKAKAFIVSRSMDQFYKMFRNNNFSHQKQRSLLINFIDNTNIIKNKMVDIALFMDEISYSHK